MTRISFATLALAGLSLFVSLPASAAQPDVDCNDPQVQMEMTYCAEQEWQAADKDLNAAYGEAMKTMRGLDANQSADMKGAEKALKEAQHHADLPVQCRPDHAAHGRTGTTGRRPR
jgi:uncharacterized protein YecT (DUF1311 family)